MRRAWMSATGNSLSCPPVPPHPGTGAFLCWYHPAGSDSPLALPTPLRDLASLRSGGFASLIPPRPHNLQRNVTSLRRMGSLGVGQMGLLGLLGPLRLLGLLRLLGPLRLLGLLGLLGPLRLLGLLRPLGLLGAPRAKASRRVCRVRRFRPVRRVRRVRPACRVRRVLARLAGPAVSAQLATQRDASSQNGAIGILRRLHLRRLCLRESPYLTPWSERSGDSKRGFAPLRRAVT